MLANLVIYVGKERAQSILEKLPEETRTDVQKYLGEMSDKKRTDPDIIVDATSVFKKAGFDGREIANRNSVFQRTAVKCVK